MGLTKARFRKLREELRDPALTALTVMLAILMFVVGPMQAVGDLGAHHFGIVVAFLLVVAIFIVSGSATAVCALLAAIAMIVVATAFRLRQPSIVDLYLDAGAWTIAGMTLNIVVARAVFAPGRVTLHRIIGAVLLYLNIGFTFVALYCFVALIAPHAFVGIAPLTDNLGVAANFAYFSFVTLTSVGYGDIVPLHPYARSLANIEAVIGQLYPATLLARLVSLEITDRRKPGA